MFKRGHLCKTELGRLRQMWNQVDTAPVANVSHIANYGWLILTLFNTIRTQILANQRMHENQHTTRSSIMTRAILTRTRQRRRDGRFGRNFILVVWNTSPSWQHDGSLRITEALLQASLVLHERKKRSELRYPTHLLVAPLCNLTSARLHFRCAGELLLFDKQLS